MILFLLVYCLIHVCIWITEFCMNMFCTNINTNKLKMLLTIFLFTASWSWFSRKRWSCWRSSKNTTSYSKPCHRCIISSNSSSGPESYLPRKKKKMLIDFLGFIYFSRYLWIFHELEIYHPLTGPLCRVRASSVYFIYELVYKLFFHIIRIYNKYIIHSRVLFTALDKFLVYQFSRFKYFFSGYIWILP